MILGRTSILASITEGGIRIEPFQEEHLKAASYSLTIGRILNRDEDTKPKEDPKDTLYNLAPGEFLLAETREHVHLGTHIAAFLSTRGSAAQVGLDVVQSSTFIEPGTDNPLVLEIHNGSQVTVPLRRGVPVVKLVFLRVEA